MRLCSSLLVVWPETTQHWSLQVVWWGKWQPPGGLTPISTSQNCCCQCLCPHGEPQPPPTSVGDLPTPASWFGSTSYGVTALFPWVLVWTRLCVCPPRVESLFPPVLWKSCNQILLDFKVGFSGDSYSHCWTPRLGSLTWVSEPSVQWENFCGIIILHLVVTHPESMGFDFIVILPLLPSHCGFPFFFGCGVSFLVGSSVFLSMVVQQLVVISVFLQEEVIAHPSTLHLDLNLHVSFWIKVFSRYMPVSGIAGSHGSSIFSFIRTSILFSIVAVSIYIPTNSLTEFPFLHTLSSIYGL